MKKILIAVVTVCQLVACASVEVKDSETPEAVEQHPVVMSLAAWFYCGLKRWPEDMAEIKKFQEVNNIELGIKANWRLLLSSEFDYTRNENYRLESNSLKNGEPFKVISVQKRPICSKGVTELNGAAIQIGDKDQ